MQQRAQLSPSNPMRPQVETSYLKIVHSNGVVDKPGPAAWGHKLAPRPFYILTYPVSYMIMVELIVRNPIDRQDFGLLIARLSLFMSAGEGGEE